MSYPLSVVYRGLQAYEPVYQAMETFTLERDEHTCDALWVVEHPPVYTQGRAGKPEHILNPDAIPVVQTNRGGQVTYHGPGQVVIYLLLDIERRKLGVRELVSSIEDAMVAYLREHNIDAMSDPDAPGVYVNGEKIGSVGLRVTRGCTYHGLSFNVDMDLTPFSGINPCGYAGMRVTQLKALGVHAPLTQVAQRLVVLLADALEYTLTDAPNERHD